jgi:hypothetical protein
VPIPNGAQPWIEDYNRVRDAGWSYDRVRRCWHHTDGRWAAASQAGILRCILMGEPVPTRDMPQTPAERTERQTNGQFTVDEIGFTRPTNPYIVVDPRPARNWSSPRVAEAVARATIRRPARPQRASGKLHPITNEAWEA